MIVFSVAGRISSFFDVPDHHGDLHSFPTRRSSDLRRRYRLGAHLLERLHARRRLVGVHRDRKSTRLNSSHANISYAVFCLKKKIKHKTMPTSETGARAALAVPLLLLSIYPPEQQSS